MGAEDFRLYGDTDEDTDSSAEDESEGFSLKAGGSRGSAGHPRRLGSNP